MKDELGLIGSVLLLVGLIILMIFTAVKFVTGYFDGNINDVVFYGIILVLLNTMRYGEK